MSHPDSTLTYEDETIEDKYLTDAYIEKMSKYPNGRAYDNLFNADMRRLMIEKYGATSAEFTTIEELTLAR